MITNRACRLALAFQLGLGFSCLVGMAGCGDDPEPEPPSTDAGDGDTGDGDVGTGDGDATPVDPESGKLKGITRLHNEVRARVPATPKLPALTWGDDIAKVAQAYADKLAKACSDTLVHSSSEERKGWGENIAFMGAIGGTAEPGSAQQTLELWESESECYMYGKFQAGVNSTCSSKCQDNGGCGHYTQLAWRNTKRVGCGTALCTQGATKKSYWVCNYDPPGNYQNQYPY